MDRAEERLGWWSAAALAPVLLLWTLNPESAVRYVLYAAPVLLVGLHLVQRRFRLAVSPRACLAPLLFAAAATLSMAVSGATGGFAQRDVFIVLGYLLLFCLRHRAPPATVGWLALLLAACLALEERPAGAHFALDILHSENVFESMFAYPLGAILLFYLAGRRWGLALLVAVLVAVSFKRVVFLGVFAAVGFDMAVRLTGLERRRGLLALGLAVLLSVVALYSRELFAFASTLLGGEGTSANSVSLGRAEFAEALWRALDRASPQALLFGHGPGSADEVLQASLEFATNPHNDWLKIVFEYGVVGLAAMHAVLALSMPRTRLGAMMHVYTAFLFLSDNVFIYTYYQVVVFLVLQAWREGPAVRSAVAPRRPLLRLKPAPAMARMVGRP